MRKTIKNFLNLLILTPQILLLFYLIFLNRFKRNSQKKRKNKRKLKILILNHNYFESGTFFRCFHFGKFLSKKGYKVTLITMNPSISFSPKISQNNKYFQIIKSPNFKIIWTIGDGLDGIDIFYRIIFAFRNIRNFDIVHAFSHKLNVTLPALTFKTFSNAVVLSDWCDWWTEGGILEDMRGKKRIFYPLERFLETKTRNLYDGITVISQALKERCTKSGIPEEKVFYLWSGCDVENIKPIPKEFAREKLNLPRNLKILTYIGLVMWDIDIILKVFKKICSLKDDVILLLVGPNIDLCSKETKKIFSQLKEKIILVEKQPYKNIPLYLGASDILLLPMKNDLKNIGRWPNKLGDYLASGKPIVASAVGEVKKFFSLYPETGLTAETIEEFTEKILFLLENPEVAEKIGKKAREISEKYSWENLTLKLEKFYERMIGNES